MSKLHPSIEHPQTDEDRTQLSVIINTTNYVSSGELHGYMF